MPSKRNWTEIIVAFVCLIIILFFCSLAYAFMLDLKVPKNKRTSVEQEKLICGISGVRYTKCDVFGCTTVCRSGETIDGSEKVVVR